MKTKKETKRKFIVFIFLYALFLVSYFGVKSLAKFASRVDSSGNVTVAKWAVSLIGADNQTLPNITIGDNSTNQDYNLSVTSNSEVALNYSLVINNVPDDLVVQIDHDTIHTPDTTTHKIIVNNLGSFIANDSNDTRNHTLSFSVPIDSDTITNQTLDIDVIFTQQAL